MRYTFVLSAAAVCLALFVLGCGRVDSRAGDEHEHGQHEHGAHEHGESWALAKHGQTAARFPGGAYALEVTGDEASGLVTAYLTDARFEPLEADAAQIRLNFAADGAPESFTLTRKENTASGEAVFTVTDQHLAELIHDGWRGKAAAWTEIGGSPYSAELVKLGGRDHHDHDHDHHDHDHRDH